MVQIAFKIIEQRIFNEENDRNEIYFHNDLFISQNQENHDVDLNLDFSHISHLSDYIGLQIDLSTIPEVDLDNPRVKGEEKKELLEDEEMENFERFTESDLDIQLKNYFINK